MTPYAPRGLEQIPVLEELSWPGDPNIPIPDIESLAINTSAYRYVGQGRIYDTAAQPHVTVIASEGFVACSGFIMRNRKSGIDTFSHFWPGETDFYLESLLDRENQTGEVNDAVVVYGGISAATGLEWGLANDRWENIKTRVVSVETGSNWWTTVFDRVAGDLTVLRRQPIQSMLKFHLFDC